MKKALFLLCMTLLGHIVYSQNYESYLQKAYSALEEGNVEAAQDYYNVYKKITEKTDTDFEVILKDAESKDAWKNNCFIVDMGNGYYIAGLKDFKYVYYKSAVQNCKSCRYGGFTDWRLPTKEEILMLLNYIPWDKEFKAADDKIKGYDLFWADKKYVVSKRGNVIKKIDGYNSRYCFPVRIFKK